MQPGTIIPPKEAASMGLPSRSHVALQCPVCDEQRVRLYSRTKDPENGVKVCRPCAINHQKALMRGQRSVADQKPKFLFVPGGKFSI